MSKHPDRDNADLTHDIPDADPLAEVYSEMVTPDIAEMNEHAERLAGEKDPDRP
ncbi:hypothetical protein [Arthrobacter wenxiniae]|uniref:Uncharacterized protein n=1 Tax=Arthrobacter wenxiniae TaxID=2713570 RepID=A0A7Y7LXC6_9MICC|nr:hypothetical protein [Arthrobacter wenxiniae]NVM93742.1 hypothetical protein [Arthrobacter wenxiniae]